MIVDPEHLPIDSPVLAIEPEDGRSRVTFKRLAAIYYLRDDEPQRKMILEALRASQNSGEGVKLTYTLATKCINGTA